MSIDTSSGTSQNVPAPLPQLSMDMRIHVQKTSARHVVNMYKEILCMFEQLAEEHDEALSKLYDALPSDYRPYVDLADHYTEEKADRIRRAVLQRGNDCRRAIVEELDKYDIVFRHQ